MMAVALRQEKPQKYTPQNGMYTRGSAAYAPQPDYNPEYAPQQPYEQPQRLQRKPESRVTVQARPILSPLQKLMAITFVICVAAALLVVLSRYARISDQYAGVLAVKNKIELTQLEIASLKVDLECSVSIDDAAATAKRHGMNYPSAKQIVAASDLSRENLNLDSSQADASDVELTDKPIDAGELEPESKPNDKVN